MTGSRNEARAVRLRRSARQALVLAAAGGLLGGLAACGSDVSNSVRVAQARVAAAEQALAEAEAAAAAAKSTFCAASATYVTALDRYGDMLTQTQTTVGDVATAGQDLAAPGQAATSAAQAAVDAQAEVALAEQDLAVAQAELAAAEASGQAAPSTPAASPSPVQTPASVARVTAAEADFASTRQGITDSTPLRQAGPQFNSAAVALELAWLQLFAESGCLGEEQLEQAAAAVADYTRALQQDLADAGYYDGEVDGVYGPSTLDAVQALQKTHGLTQTGAMDKSTQAALQSDLAGKGLITAQETIASTAALQQTLALAGYWDGPIDGQWSDELTAALQKLQTDLGVEPTGTVDAATIAAGAEALATARQTPTPSPTSPSPTPSPSP